MPPCTTLNGDMKSQREKERQGFLADDPDVQYLLGFEGDKVAPLPVKTYIRRLWLAFQSSKKSLMPRHFFDPVAETFSKEIEAQVSDYVKDEDRLADEIAKDPIVLDQKTGRCRSAFLEDTARTMLITREWGDKLWGSRTFCRSPLANEKRELGDDEPPQWPKDQNLIIMAVRHWMAARLQDKLRNSRQAKKCPRVESAKDPAQTRESCATAVPGTTLYNSKDEIADTTTQGPVNTAEATPLKTPRQHSRPRISIRQQRPSTDAVDIEQLQWPCSSEATNDTPPHQALSKAVQRKSTRGGATRLSSLSHRKPGVALSQTSNQLSNKDWFNTVISPVDANDPSSRKRKRGVNYAKPRRTASTERESENPLPTPASSIAATPETLERVFAPAHEPS